MTDKIEVTLASKLAVLLFSLLSRGQLVNNNTTMGRSSLCSIGTDFNSKHWLSLDICGLICLTFSYTLHLFALFASGFTLIGHHLLAQLLYGEFVRVGVLDDNVTSTHMLFH